MNQSIQKHLATPVTNYGALGQLYNLLDSKPNGQCNLTFRKLILTSHILGIVQNVSQYKSRVILVQVSKQ